MPLIVRFLDSGVGDATWIATPAHNYVVDCGPQSYGRQLVFTLQSAGVAKIDGLFISDDRLDRIGGCVDVMRSLRPDFVVWPRTPTSTAADAFIATKNLLALPTQDWRQGAGLPIANDSTQLTVLNPSAPEAPVPAGLDGDSLALAVDYAGARILLVDDNGRSLTNPFTPAGPARVLGIGSHASAAIGVSQALGILQPDYVIASTPRLGAVAGPDPGMLDAFQLQLQSPDTDSRRFFKTAVNGTVVVVVSQSDPYTSPDVRALSDR
jgi:beta-lactamase superfamily II metal-dependent hydrolase